MNKTNTVIHFPPFTGTRCLMMPYIQGEPDSVPESYRKGYEEALESVYDKLGEIGYLTIDESKAVKGKPHRGTRSSYGRPLHTEAGRLPEKIYCWGGGGSWGGNPAVVLDRGTRVLLANNLDNSCALWDAEQEETSMDGDIGYLGHLYPYKDAVMMKAGEVYDIGIFTPHESLPVKETVNRQFLRIVGSGVHGRESYFTENPLVKLAA